MTQPTDVLPSIHQLKVTLRDVRPAVWRRLLVPSAVTLEELSGILQLAFDWDGGHLHEFEVNSVRYGPPELQNSAGGSPFFDEPARNERVALLHQVAVGAGAVLDYTYDLGDDWRHRIEVEEVSAADPEQLYPSCTDGRGLAPEEDTGQNRPGHFDKDALQLMLYNGFGAVRGRDLAAVDASLIDPVFTGLFPGLLAPTDGLCECGEDHGDQGAPELRPLKPVPNDVLAQLAAETSLVTNAIALAQWVGDKRTLTPSRMLRPADAAQAVAELGLFGAEVKLPAAKKKPDAKQLLRLQGLWSAALAADLIQVTGSRASRGAGLEIWESDDQDDDDASLERVESWAQMLAGLLRTRVERDQGLLGPFSDEHLVPASAQLYYTIARQPVPAVMPALLLAAAMESDPLETLSLFLQLPDAMEAVAQDWILAGVLTEADDSDDSYPGSGDSERHRNAVDGPAGAMMELLLGDPSNLSTETATFLRPLLDAMQAGSTVQLTPLGSYGLARLLGAHGWEVPLVGACAGLSPDRILDELDFYPVDEDAMTEAEIWLAARGDEWQTALQGVIESAQLDEPQQGPARRATFELMMYAIGPRAEPILDSLAGDPWLSALAARIRNQLHLGPEPTLSERLWLSIDALTMVLDLDDDELVELVLDSQAHELLRQPGAAAAAANLTHPRSREMLQLIADLTDDPRITYQVQRALGDKQARRSNSARKPRSKAKKSRNR